MILALFLSSTGLNSLSQSAFIIQDRVLRLPLLLLVPQRVIYRRCACLARLRWLQVFSVLREGLEYTGAAVQPVFFDSLIMGAQGEEDLS